MAPAVLVAQGVAITDLDGPLLLAEDRETALQFDADGVHHLILHSQLPIGNLPGRQGVIKGVSAKCPELGCNH